MIFMIVHEYAISNWGKIMNSVKQCLRRNFSLWKKCTWKDWSLVLPLDIYRSLLKIVNFTSLTMIYLSYHWMHVSGRFFIQKYIFSKFWEMCIHHVVVIACFSCTIRGVIHSRIHYQIFKSILYDLFETKDFGLNHEKHS